MEKIRIPWKQVFIVVVAFTFGLLTGTGLLFRVLKSKEQVQTQI
jgi:hypothetical protein